MNKTKMALLAGVTAIAIVLVASIALAYGMNGKEMQGCPMMNKGMSMGQMDHTQMHKQMHQGAAGMQSMHKGNMQDMHNGMSQEQMQQMHNAHHGTGMR